MLQLHKPVLDKKMWGCIVATEGQCLQPQSTSPQSQGSVLQGTETHRTQNTATEAAKYGEGGSQKCRLTIIDIGSK